jgi:hypothetical protein
MNRRFFSVALLGALTAWAAVGGSWAAPGLAGIAAGQALLAAFWLRAQSGRPWPRALLGSSALTYSGLAYLVALLAGTPETTKFWLVFGVSLAIVAPVVVLLQRLLRDWAREGTRDRSPT